MPSIIPVGAKPAMAGNKAPEKKCCGGQDKGMSCSCGDNGCGCHKHWGGGCCGMGKKIMVVLAGILLVYLICFVGSLIRNNVKKYFFIGKADRGEHSIMVTGIGKSTGANDIAVTTIGYSNTDKDVAKAQLANKAVMDKIMGELKQMGVADKDLQSNYSIYPDYNYTQDQGQVLLGYRVTNQITIKIRDLTKIAAILGLAGKYGATEVNGLSFTIDDTENIKSEARGKALADAKIKAVKLANSLGVRLGTVMYYNEYDSGVNNYYPSAMVGAEKGGAVALGPEDVSAGSRDVMMNVSITYEILP